MSLENTKKALEIIPVIDLLDGQVVHARRGNRQHYQPIQSSLCNGSEPLTILQALLELYPFDRLYIADINAIQKRSNHRQIIADIKAHYPHLQIWLDAGISGVNDLSAWSGINLNWVIGSESLRRLDDYLSLKKLCGESHVLSLDFALDSTGQGYQGPSELIEESTHWPDKVIAMTLSLVGSDSGPDNQLLAQLINRSSGQKIYAAGGVRHTMDIQQLKEMGVGGALIASALHNQQITSAELGSLLNINPV
ncbi:MAG TPA: HisA/HisF-related TIM barrel protein [Methylophilaceae bacterium]|nr:HisA/HisF-related TIM barrel protein [Methylophilaceae bacterium]